MKPWKTVFPAATLAAIALVGVVLGASDRATATTQLVRGWNNVPYFGPTKPPAEALASLGSNYSAVYRWNTTKQQYDVYAPGLPAFGNTLAEIATGDAVWIHMTGESGTLPGMGNTAPGPTSGHIAIAASTFQPMSDLALYEKTFNQINPVGTDEASKRYFAPVILPDGVTITSMTAAFEATGGDVQVRLDYTPLANGNNAAQIFKLVEVLSSSGTSPQTASAFAHTVDNNANVYFLVVDLTGGAGTKLRGVSIAYTY
jgi:hypothetical protein